jgi:DNA-binding transcriptional MerR regulator
MVPAAADQRGRPVTKSAAAFRTISEVSAELDIPQHVLRFWETKFPQIRPLKRGGGRRYYRPEDVELLRHIQSLLHREGYTIRGVQRLLRETRGGQAEAAPPPPGESFAAPRAEPPAPAPDQPGPVETAAPDVEASAVPEAVQDKEERRRGELRMVLDELVALRDLLRGGGQG